MQEEFTLHQQFNTSLPYLPIPDTSVGQEFYVDFLIDSVNLQKSDSTFVFELTDIVLPDSIANPQIQLYNRQSVFVPYKSKPVEITPVLRNEINMDWLTGLFILCLIILTWIKYEGGRRVTQLFKAVFARHNMNQLLRDGDIIHERITPALMFLYLVSFSTLIMLWIKPYNVDIPWADSPFLKFSILISAIMILWMLKLSLIGISGKIFRTKNETSEYMVTNIIYNVATGLIAFPFLMAGHYADSRVGLYIAMAVFAVGLALKVLRSIFVGLSAQSFPLVYLFLYLCTLEFLPLLVIYKLLIS